MDVKGRRGEFLWPCDGSGEELRGSEVELSWPRIRVEPNAEKQAASPSGISKARRESYRT